MESAFNSSKTSSSFQPNYFCILSARDTIQTLNRPQDIRLLPNGSAFSNNKLILKYDSFKIMKKTLQDCIFSALPSILPIA